MKKQILIAGALLLSFAAFSQTKENTRNDHGTQVSTVAKSETEARAHGDIVSGVASSKSQGSAEARAERRQRHEARKASDNANKDAASTRREEARAERADQVESGINIESGDRVKKDSEADKGVKAKNGVKAEADIKGHHGSKAGIKTGVGTDVQLSRPNIKVGSRLNVGAGIF